VAAQGALGFKRSGGKPLREHPAVLNPPEAMATGSIPAPATVVPLPPRRQWRVARSTVRLFGQHLELWALMLAALDFALLACAVPLARFIWFDGDITGPRADLLVLKLESVLFAAVILSALVAMGLYNRRLDVRMSAVIARMVAGVTIGALAMGTVVFFMINFDVSRGALALAVAIGLVLVMLSRALFVKFLGRDRFAKRILVFGTGRRAADLQEVHVRQDLQGFEVVGYVASESCPGLVPRELRINPGMGLREFSAEADVDEVVVALDDRRCGLPVQQLLECRMAGLPVTDVLTFIERESGRVELSMLYPSWLIFSENINRRGVWRVLNRLLDLGAASILLVATMPVMLLAALAIWADAGFRGRIFYQQERVGRESRPFTLYKFRSMREDAEANGAAWAQADDPRITRVGRLIRRTRIDELPQLLNVLRGDMSFVGPRPERPEFVGELSERIPYYRERHCVKPGITGWAQLCYQYGASEEDALEKLKYDLYYVKNKSLLFDLMILLQTVEVVLWQKGSR